MATFTRHSIDDSGAVVIEITDDIDGYIELTADDTGITLHALGIARLDDDAATTLIDALTRWKHYRRIL